MEWGGHLTPKVLVPRLASWPVVSSSEFRFTSDPQSQCPFPVRGRAEHGGSPNPLAAGVLTPGSCVGDAGSLGALLGCPQCDCDP